MNVLNREETKMQLVVNKLTRQAYDELSSLSALNERQLYFITDQPYVAVDISAIGKVDLEPIEADLSALSSSMVLMEGQIQDISSSTDISAIQERLDEVDEQMSAIDAQMAEMSAFADYI